MKLCEYSPTLVAKASHRSEQFKMETDLPGLLTLLAEHIYSDPNVFVRELLQNAHDAIVLRRLQEPDHKGRIDVVSDPEAGTLTFSDNGIGMGRNEVRRFLSIIGSSSKAGRNALANLKAAAEGDLIGQFGVGMMSAFVVAERLEVISRQKGSKAVLWQNNASVDCTLSDGARSAIGTDVRLHIRPEFKYCLDEEYLQETIISYGNLLPFPITLNHGRPINAMNAPWHSPDWNHDETREKACAAFLDSFGYDKPLDIIPFDLDGEVKARGVLYITREQIPEHGGRGTLHVFIKHMFVTDREESLLPPWARFVRGVRGATVTRIASLRCSTTTTCRNGS